MRIFLIAVSLWAVALDVHADVAADRRAIQRAFSTYKNALLAGDGAKAADAVSARTIAYYDGILTHVLNTPRTKLAELDFISRFMVLRIRHEFTKAQITEMTGRELLATGVQKGWISKSTVASIEELVKINVVSSEATAAMPQAPAIPAFHFVKESGQWKLDLVGSFPLAIEAMQQEIKKAGMTEDQFIVTALNMLSETKVDERIYSPPR